MPTLLLPTFTVVGIVVRTTNQAGQAREDIGQLWEQFWSQNVRPTIPDRASDAIYCLYTDYETDAHGPYTTLIGCQVRSVHLPLLAGLVAKIIPAAQYQQFDSVGPLPGAVVATWQQIWAADLNRLYGADFDVYSPPTSSQAEPSVKTYVSVRLR